LNDSGDSYAGHAYYEFLDTNHHTTNAPPPGWVCNDGVRISVERPPMEVPPPCVPPE
jgi:hypothetical protein